MNAKAKRRLEGVNNPLEMYDTPQEATMPAVERKREELVSILVRLTPKTADRMKNAVVSELPNGVTMSRFAEEAISKHIDQLERKRGEPFPQRKVELRGGRPPR